MYGWLCTDCHVDGRNHRGYPKKVFCHVEDKLFQSIHTVVKSIYVERKGGIDD